MSDPIKIAVEVTNPGQFFACCGFLELANRLWPGCEAWFEGRHFCVLRSDASVTGSAAALFDQVARCALTNTMSAQQLARLNVLAGMKAAARTTALDEEKKSLERLRREEPILLHSPFNLRVDWFHDDRAGGSRFKTWAGQQSVLDIASSMKATLQTPDWRTRAPDEWFTRSVSGCGLPFNFDSDLGGQGSALDIGFSFDPLASSPATRIDSSARPCLELFAFVGLQRFRPRQLGNGNRFLYCAWNYPLSPQIAAPAASGMLPMSGAPLFEFRLLYRTKYLKSFLPAIPFSGGSDE